MNHFTIKYYNEDTLETTIYVDRIKKEVSIENHTDDIIHLAFGLKTNPTWADFEAFLEDRCPPRNRQNLKEILETLDVSFYDPITICEKTHGRMEEDNSWMDFEYLEEQDR